LQNKSPNLIADIGGTNARFALVNDPESQPFEAKTLRCADYETLVDATEAYLKQVDYPRPRHAALSIATPVAGDYLEMTNHVWSFSIRQVRQLLRFESLKVLNDYTALALALPHFSANDYLQIGGKHSPQGPVLAVLGPGTGLGVSAVTKAGHLWMPLQGEGGHVSYGPLDEREAGVIAIIRRKLTHVSAESLASGPGLSLLYQSIATLDGITVEPTEPKKITAMAMQQKSAIAEETVSMFCSILGTVAGNLALTLGARGGVFIGGGIVPQLGEYFSKSLFRSRFEKHGRFTQYLQKIPTYVIHSKYPALQGAAIALSEDYNNLGVTSVESE
jgi:glucokinase